MITWLDCPGIERIAGKVGGKALIQNTRVPVYAIIQNYEGGSSVAEIAENYPGVSVSMIERIIDFYHRYGSELNEKDTFGS